MLVSSIVNFFHLVGVSVCTQHLRDLSPRYFVSLEGEPGPFLKAVLLFLDCFSLVSVSPFLPWLASIWNYPSKLMEVHGGWTKPISNEWGLFQNNLILKVWETLHTMSQRGIFWAGVWIWCEAFSSHMRSHTSGVRNCTNNTFVYPSFLQMHVITIQVVLTSYENSLLWKCCREKPVQTQCWNFPCFAFVIIITHNGHPEKILPLCLTVKVPLFRTLSTYGWQAGRN